MASTRWVDRLNKTDAEVDGKQEPIFITDAFDGNVGIDLSADVADGAMLTSLETHLVRMPTVLETDYVDADAQLVGAPTATGDVVAQRVGPPWMRDRCYRLEVSFGPGGNRKGSGILICCGE